MTLLLVISGFPGAASSEAAPPDWWGTPQTIFVGPANDGAVASKGQVMHMARKAKEHLDLILGPVGGAGAEITRLFTDYAANNGIAVKNNQAIRIGQVKHIASKFWKRLQAAGAPDIPLQPAWPYHRNSRDIWTQSPNDDADTALAALGQVKSAFSFDIPGEAPLRARNFAWLWDGRAGAA